MCNMLLYSPHEQSLNQSIDLQVAQSGIEN